MIVLVCGSRTWQGQVKSLQMMNVLEELNPDEIIVGGAEGADRLAEVWAKAHSVPVTVITANWRKEGRSAGIKRNNRMLDRNPDRVLAFWDGQSKGTKHTIDQARRRGIKVEVYYAGSGDHAVLEGTPNPRD